MKYIFLIFCAIGLFLLTALTALAQSYSLKIEVKNIPAVYCTDFHQYPNPNGHYCDSVHPLTFKESFYFDKINAIRDTIVYSYDSNHSGLLYGESIIENGRLTLIYDSVSRSIKQMLLTTSYDDLIISKVNDDDETSSGLKFSIEGFSVLGKDSTIEVSFIGAEILLHNFHYADYSNSSHTHLFSTDYTNSSDTSTGAVYDSSSISINLSTSDLSGVHSSLVIPLANLMIYPNPATNTISVIAITQDEHIEFIDVLGRALQVPVVSKSNDQTNYNVSSLPPGIYFLRAGDQMQKFVIQR